MKAYIKKPKYLLAIALFLVGMVVVQYKDPMENPLVKTVVREVMETVGPWEASAQEFYVSVTKWMQELFTTTPHIVEIRRASRDDALADMYFFSNYAEKRLETDEYPQSCGTSEVQSLATAVNPDDPEDRPFITEEYFEMSIAQKQEHIDGILSIEQWSNLLTKDHNGLWTAHVAIYSDCRALPMAQYLRIDVMRHQWTATMNRNMQALLDIDDRFAPEVFGHAEPLVKVHPREGASLLSFNSIRDLITSNSTWIGIWVTLLFLPSVTTWQAGRQLGLSYAQRGVLLAILILGILQGIALVGLVGLFWPDAKIAAYSIIINGLIITLVVSYVARRFAAFNRGDGDEVERWAKAGNVREHVWLVAKGNGYSFVASLILYSADFLSATYVLVGMFTAAVMSIVLAWQVNNMSLPIMQWLNRKYPRLDNVRVVPEVNLEKRYGWLLRTMDTRVARWVSLPAMLLLISGSAHIVLTEGFTTDHEVAVSYTRGEMQETVKYAVERREQAEDPSLFPGVTNYELVFVGDLTDPAVVAPIMQCLARVKEDEKLRAHVPAHPLAGWQRHVVASGFGEPRKGELPSQMIAREYADEAKAVMLVTLDEVLVEASTRKGKPYAAMASLRSHFGRNVCPSGECSEDEWTLEKYRVSVTTSATGDWHMRADTKRLGEVCADLMTSTNAGIPVTGRSGVQFVVAGNSPVYGLLAVLFSKASELLKSNLLLAAVMFFAIGRILRAMYRVHLVSVRPWVASGMIAFITFGMNVMTLAVLSKSGYPFDTAVLMVANVALGASIDIVAFMVLSYIDEYIDSGQKRLDTMRMMRQLQDRRFDAFNGCMLYLVMGACALSRGMPPVEIVGWLTAVSIAEVWLLSTMALPYFRWMTR